MVTIALPKRADVKPQDTWDLSSLFASEALWEKGRRAWEKMIPGYARGVLLQEGPPRRGEGSHWS